ncbi:MAG: four helix bundle protein [Bacteroidetes bacterium]|nr:four helix bundle protein [Bacteroidota bacterium]
MERPTTFGTWEATVPSDITADAVWKIEAYRLGLFLADLAWFDASNLLEERRSRRIADQLVRSAGSISANIEEGYSHRTGKDRARFYTYALGSARETRGWYFKGRHVFSSEVTAHRLDLTTQIIRLLLTMIPDQRRRNYMVEEEAVVYRTNAEIPY